MALFTLKEINLDLRIFTWVHLSLRLERQVIVAYYSFRGVCGWYVWGVCFCALNTVSTQTHTHTHTHRHTGPGRLMTLPSSQPGMGPPTQNSLPRSEPAHTCLPQLGEAAGRHVSPPQLMLHYQAGASQQREKLPEVCEAAGTFGDFFLLKRMGSLNFRARSLGSLKKGSFCYPWRISFLLFFQCPFFI